MQMPCFDNVAGAFLILNVKLFVCCLHDTTCGKSVFSALSY